MVTQQSTAAIMIRLGLSLVSVMAFLSPAMAEPYWHPHAITTPVGTVTLNYSKQNNDRMTRNISIVITQSHKNKIFNLNEWNSLSFYKTEKNKAYYKVNNSYIVPLIAGNGNMCDENAVVFVAIGINKKITLLTPKEKDLRCGVFQFNPKGDVLNLSKYFLINPYGNRTPLARRWKIVNGNIINEKSYKPELSNGFHKLSVPQKSLLEVNTSYGKLTFVKGKKSDIIKWLKLNRRYVFESKSGSYVGFLPKIFHINGHDLVIVRIIPDMAQGDLFRIFDIGPRNIYISKVFGTSFTNITYKIVGSKLLLHMGDYSYSCYGLKCEESGNQEIRGITNRGFEYIDHDIKAVGAHAKVYRSREFKYGRINWQNASTSIIPPWYNYTNYGACVKSVPRDPATMIKFDRLDGLVDQVNIFEQDHGKPMAVQIGEPENNGMVAITTFFRTRSLCLDYAREKQDQINELK